LFGVAAIVEHRELDRAAADRKRALRRVVEPQPKTLLGVLGFDTPRILDESDSKRLRGGGTRQWNE